MASANGLRCRGRSRSSAFAAVHNQFLRELQVWLDLPAHPHILPLRFVRTLGEEQVLFTDYMPGGSLQDRLGQLALGEILDLAIQYAWGLHARVLGRWRTAPALG